MITVVGMDGSPLGSQAEAALRSATLVVGGRRHLAALPAVAAVRSAGVRTVELGELAPALDALAAHDDDAVVLASGDPGFFGIVRALRERGLAAVVLPAVSSVALAFARAGLPWDDALVVSAHGRDPRPAVNVCRAHPKVAVLTGPGAGPAEIAAALAGWDRRLVVCEQLGSGDEQITECSLASANRTWTDPNVVLVLAGASPATPSATPASRITAVPATGSDRRAWLSHPRPSRGSRLTFMRDDGGSRDAGGTASTASAGGTASAGSTASTGDAASAGDAGGAGNPVGAVWALGEEQFDSRDAVITKAEVRALALARLAPAPGMLVWDVGAGSGSVGVECARFGAAVIAVERDARRCDRIRANAQRHAVDVRTVQGEAPHALDGLPPPDAAFVGGGGQAVIEAVAGRRPARIVVALAAVERAGAALATLAAAGYAADGVLLQAARFAPLPGDVHRLAATNPVFLVWGTASRGASS
jgi:precorrin-6Y C5,15-methyltransferase (decarboxylating)